MKRVTMTLAIALATTMISCNKDEAVNPNGGNGEQVGDAFVSVSISAPQTRANDYTDDGTTEPATATESKVNEVALLAFDNAYNFIGTYTEGDLTPATGENPAIYTCAVAGDASRFFVVVNYKTSTVLEAAVKNMSGVAHVSNPLYQAIEMSIDDVKTMVDGKIIMTNAGAFEGGQDVSLVSLPEGTKLSDDKDNPTDLNINVDRIVSKFKATAPSTLSKPNAADYVNLEGVKLNATNKSVYAYSTINMVSPNHPDADYRVDPNMDLEKDGADMTTGDELNWLANNKDETNFNPITSSTEYVLENTARATYQNYNNLTQAVIKAKYTPIGSMTKVDTETITDGQSWFAVDFGIHGTLNLTFAALVDLYNNGMDITKEGVTTKYEFTAADKAKMDTQLQWILSDNTMTWASSSLTLGMLDAVKNGGYKAATVPNTGSVNNYVVRYYQNSINYYDIFIQHDDSIEKGHLGRWGMVRNNAYTLNVTGVKNAGLPYIPAPFDTTITDPKNPNPEDPEPADKLDAYIDAQIVVNEWTIWTQDSVLE